MSQCYGLGTNECYSMVNRDGQLCQGCQITQLKSLLVAAETKADKWEKAYKDMVNDYKAFCKSIVKKAALVH